ncbi:hypothetical protein [Nitrincola lacisaponensis]|uniref:hypothetical protein n=1 Tax=Nitrincola lacisaponensis TaxID=267850 RepID=UPI000564259F|nr:hypothetical protein [Nitrincola lacisaponensis]
MLDPLNRMSRMIPDNAPKPFVLGILLWFIAAALMLLAFGLTQLDWTALYKVVFSLMLLVIIGFMACVVWFLVELITGRKTPWRSRENT